MTHGLLKLLVGSVDMTKCPETFFSGNAKVVDMYHVSFQNLIRITWTPNFLPHLKLFSYYEGNSKRGYNFF